MAAQIYSPPADSESGFPFFPGIADALSEIPGREVWRAARAVSRAAAALRELA
ncbi:unnamed protein product [Spirodela intermedia]|uniref:Uncharacterized protein n=1 Tax=Spirodela intermedia TaxID=51605 RepID=A0A7I8IYD6_SPIIN|nr:unnamed protein product [Spirodela intermedia]CAA6662819.1 unnamed protein product [Spirodela intermedia]